MKKNILIFLSLMSFLNGFSHNHLIENRNSEFSLFWWRPSDGSLNFGDEISYALIKRILKIKNFKFKNKKNKLFAVGSIFHFAKDGDIIWGSGINGKHLNVEDYNFKFLDVRAVRGPLSRKFLLDMGIFCPPVYGDPALLLPLFFPEFKKSPEPKIDYIVIPHSSEMHLFVGKKNVVFPTEPWDMIVKKILESKFVISSSLHGIVVAEAFGIPARLLKVTNNEPIFKYKDYYLGTGRKSFSYAISIEEALKMGGEEEIDFDPIPILEAFPLDLFKNF